MRDYPKVGGRQGKPGYRVPRYFLSRSIQMARKLSDNKFYGSFYKNFKKRFDFSRFQKSKQEK
jgi:hypothetical protein